MRSKKLQRWAAASAALFSLVASGAQMVSVDHTGTNASGSGVGEAFAISGDGRYAAFSSGGTNYVLGDTNGLSDVFVYDCLLRSNVWNTCYSAANISPNIGSQPLGFTPDGRFLLFLSRATNHVPGLSFPFGANYHLYVHDLASNINSVVTVSHDGTNMADGSVSVFGSVDSPRLLSSDGRFVVFGSTGTNMVFQNDRNGGFDVFCRDLVDGTTELVTVSPDGSSALDRPAGLFFSSTNARYIAFDSSATNVVPGLTNTTGLTQIYWRDRLAGTNALVSVATNGTFSSRAPLLRAVSSDGRFVAFASFATDFTADVNDNNGTHDLFIRDMLLGETWLVTRNTNGATTGGRHSGGRFSSNGEWLLFAPTAADLAPGILDANGGSPDLFIHHLPTRTNGLLSMSFTGDRSANASVSDGFARLSSSGRFTLFTSLATNLLPNTTNAAQRLFLRDQQAGLTRNAFHVGLFPTPAFNQARIAISENERYVFFLTHVNFDPFVNKTNSAIELFRAPLYPPRLLPSSGDTIHAEGLAGATYVLESSSNLLHWTALYTNAASADGTFSSIAPQPPSGLSRFYRLLWP